MGGLPGQGCRPRLCWRAGASCRPGRDPPVLPSREANALINTSIATDPAPGLQCGHANGSNLHQACRLHTPIKQNFRAGS